MIAPLPLYEAERLQELQQYQILDTAPEAAFERLTSLAAKFFDVPVALVTLIDADRQWIKACFGVDVREVPRTLTFCAHAILSNIVMAVPDAREDPRFLDNMLVTGPPFIRSYLGAPLISPGGRNLGTFCILDVVPREFTAEQHARLAEMAALVVDEFELRKTARELRESELALREAVRKNNQLIVAVTNLTSGVVITDPSLPDNPIIFANAGFYATTGYSADDTIGHNCRFLQGPATDPATVDKIRRAIAQRVSFAGLLVNYRKDGSSFVNELNIDPVFGEEGQLLSFVGLQNDVTERELARELLEQRVSERTAELAHSQIEILNRLARAAEYRDDDTGQHTQRVARTSCLLAQALGLPPEQVSWIKQAAVLHDVGKIGISDLILLKPGKLTDEEFTLMRTHAATGSALLSNGHSEVVKMAERIARSHHERFDGKGYPEALSGEQIPLEARILSIADVFDALTHERPYKPAWPIAAAVAEISSQSGRQFDPRLVQAFLTLAHSELV